MDVVDWLLAGDPAIRWQVMRDLTDGDAAPERARIPHAGLGAQILHRQGRDGGWQRGDAPPWFPTLFNLTLLRATGVDPSDPAVAEAIERLATGFRWDAEFGSKPFFEGEVEPCINGGTLALGGYFGRPDHALARRLLGEQLADGGWNCDAPTKSDRSSFHTTICVLEGLLDYERATGATDIAPARLRGETYLLERGLFRRRSTNEVADPAFLQLAFPPRCYYDVLRALDYLRAAGVRPDERMDDAVQTVEAKRRPDGRWLLEASHADFLDFAFGEVVGAPSRWNTLRALRVLRWYQQS